MFSTVWFWLFVAERFIASTCPRTSKLGSILNMLSMAAILVFIVLSFFFAEQWYYGLILGAIYLLVPFFTPRVDANNMSGGGIVWSMIGSHLVPFITIAIYICFFKGI